MTFRRSLRAALDRGAHRSGVLRWFERRMHAGLTVLMYHRVLGEADCREYPFPSLVMPEAMFVEQVAWLAQHAKVVPVGVALDELDQPPTRPLVSITFDDGYWDNSEIAAPILERHGLRATFFVTTEFVRTGVPMWFDRVAAVARESTDEALARAARESGIEPPTGLDLAPGRVRSWVAALKRVDSTRRAAFLAATGGEFDDRPLRTLCRAMRPEDVQALAQHGHEIGSHSVSHEILPLAGERELEQEMHASRRELEAWCATPVTGFCYPNGSFDERVVAAAGRAGYRYACTTAPPAERRPGDLLRIGRFDITRDRVTRSGGAFDPLAFRAEVCGLRSVLR